MLAAVLGRERAGWAATSPASHRRSHHRRGHPRHPAHPGHQTSRPRRADQHRRPRRRGRRSRAAVAAWLHRLYPGQRPAGSPRCVPTCSPNNCSPPPPTWPASLAAAYATSARRPPPSCSANSPAPGPPPVPHALDRLLASHLPDLLAAASLRRPAGWPTCSTTLYPLPPAGRGSAAGRPATRAQHQPRRPRRHPHRAGRRPPPAARRRPTGRVHPRPRRSLNNLSTALAELGRREEALAAIDEAVSLYRRLAAARPDAFTPDLARSLNNLSIRLADLGRREEALAAIDEAVTATGGWPPPARTRSPPTSPGR